MIKSHKSKIHEKLLDWFLDREFEKNFSTVNFIHETKIDFSQALLIIGNHSTWWDGFLIWQMNRQVLKKKFHLMMLESQLKKFWFFQKIGCFSIDPGNRSVVESLKYAAQILENKQNIVAFYPQGQLHSIFDENILFNKGIEVILKNNAETDVLFYALFVDYSSNSKPYLNVFLKVIHHPNQFNYKQLENIYKLFYAESKQTHIQQFKP